MPSILVPAVRRLSAVAAVAASVFAAPGLMAQTAFTYQGQLKSGGSAVNGTADVRFTLYNALSGGSVVGAPIDVLGVSVTNGLISTPLNFGALAFDGNPRWIEIAVRSPAGGGAYTTLTPRQPINPAPYAMYALNSNSPFVPSGGNAVYTGAGNVGVGTPTPTGGKFVVQTPTSTYGMLHTDGTRTMGTWVGPTGGWFGTTSNSDLSLATNNATSNILLKTTGDVGIGQTSPDGRLHISGGPVWTTNGWTKSLTLDNAAAIMFGKGAATRFGMGESLNGMYYFTTTTDTATAAANYYMWVNSAGHVFMGNSATITGNSPLTVGGTGTDWTIFGQAGVNGVGVVGTQATGTGRGVWGTVGANGFGGVVGDHAGGGTFGILGSLNEGVYGTGGAGGRIGVTGVSAGNSGVVGGASVGTSTAGVFGYSTASNGNGIIAEANNGTAAYAVWGRAAQGVGGYFSGGQYAIIAAGKARVNTIEIIGGSDLAEPFDVAHLDEQGSEQDIEPGMVVVIDPANPGALKVAASANDRKVAGIISGANDLAPGMVMKAEGAAHADGDYPVALTGRVWCWCDSATGAIEPGDMLTTSDVAGHAMKAVDLVAAQGAIIGKAMTPLASGERGLVLVLVNLQ